MLKNALLKDAAFATQHHAGMEHAHRIQMDLCVRVSQVTKENAVKVIVINVNEITLPWSLCNIMSLYDSVARNQSDFVKGEAQ